MPGMTTILRYVGPAVVAAFVAFIAAWTYQGNRYTAKIETIRREHSEAVTESIRKVQIQAAVAAAHNAAVDRAKTEELQNANVELEILRRRVDAADVSLRVRAKCPAAVPAASPAARVDTAGTAELDPAVRPDYFALRSGIERQRIQLEACIATLKGRAE